MSLGDFTCGVIRGVICCDCIIAGLGGMSIWCGGIMPCGDAGGSGTMGMETCVCCSKGDLP